ncbi:hypothetical protein FGO68_gene12712 [Halteria grandinella]|uniref:Histidine kinase n=1 Tax=Halteria grandinella TaxID=5974 RepID=A0A8J8T7A5_HALGN|nr:hypothetical protein FGO68_gene12712 [Halteria grandinella]
MLTATVSHEMRTPLNATLGLGEELKNYISSDVGIELHHIMMNSSRLLLSLVNDLLDLFRLKNGKFKINEALYNFREEIGDIMRLFQVQAQSKELKLIFDCDRSVPKLLTCDIQRVKQVLINLVGNALKFTFKGSIVVTAKIIKNENSERHLEMRVCDTGIGIREHDKDKIFKMFGKLEATEKINTTGIGLGVSICKQIIEGLGGTLSLVEGCDSLQCLQKLVYSYPTEQSEGTTFQFQIKINDLEDYNEDYPHQQKYREIEDLQEASPGKRQNLRGNTFKQGRKLVNKMVSDKGGNFMDQSEIDLMFPTMPMNELIMQDYIQADVKNTMINIEKKLLKQQINKPDESTPKTPQTPQLRINDVDNLDFMTARMKNGKKCPCQMRNKVLVVDDNVFNILTLQCMLKESLKMESDKALNGLQAVQRVQARASEVSNEPCLCGMESPNYRLIFMDCNMPVMDGLQATQEIRRLLPNANIKIVALTAYTTEGFEKKCFASGMDDYKTKPIYKDVLKEIVQQSLANSQII